MVKAHKSHLYSFEKTIKTMLQLCNWASHIVSTNHRPTTKNSYVAKLLESIRKIVHETIQCDNFNYKLENVLTVCERCPSNISNENYWELFTICNNYSWSGYATVLVKKIPLGDLTFFHFFHKQLRIFNRFLHTYCAFLSTLDYKFFLIISNYAILNATTQFT